MAARESFETASKCNFVLQQGLEKPSSPICPRKYSALIFQPRIIAVVLLIGVLLQSAILFFALGAVLWWCALLPRLNPFDAVYNHLFAGRPDKERLGPAPAPRRFAQMLAGCFSIAIGALLATEHYLPAYGIELLFASAAAAIALGRFCLGSFLFHIIRGKTSFALRTLPWAGGDRNSSP